MKDSTATISVNGGKEFPMEKNGSLNPEAIAELAKVIGVAPKDHNVKVGGLAVDQLKSIIARVEKLEEEKSGLTADITDVFAEAKGNGFDVKAIKTIIKIRKLDASEREEQESILDTYMAALGMIPQFEMEV